MQREMYAGLSLTAAPTAEPVSPVDVRSWGRLSSSTGEFSDAILNQRIKSARELLEIKCEIALVTQTWTMTLDRFPGGGWIDGDLDWAWAQASGIIQLPPPYPWQSIVSVSYIDAGGTTQVLAGSAYRFDIPRGRLMPTYGTVWPVTRWQPACVTIVFKSGYGDTGAECPAQARECLLEIVEDRLRNRGGMFALAAGTKEKLASLWSGIT